MTKMDALPVNSYLLHLLPFHLHNMQLYRLAVFRLLFRSIFVKSIAMKNFSLLFIIIFSFLIKTTGQSILPVNVQGKIISNPSKEPIVGATIILSSKETVYQKKTVFSDSKGEFLVKVPPASYELRIEGVNIEPYILNNFVVTTDTTLTTISLKQNVKQLSNVNVVAAKSDIELKAEKKVFNVGKDILSKGGNATDVLNNVPSVNVDPMGNISLRGNANVRILINGKPSMLTTPEGIRQIQAASIDKIEVITNPSSAYEAQGSAGIINIILKKNSQYGFNASLQGSIGSPVNNGVNANMSYKTKKVNLFSNIGYRYTKYFNIEEIYRVNKTGDGSELSQKIENKDAAGNVNLYVGMDYYINDKNTLTGSYYYARRDNEDTTRYQYNYFNKTGSSDSSITRFEDYWEPQIFNEIELNYVRTFKKPGRKWTTSLQYAFWNDDENQQITQNKLGNGNTGNLHLVSRDIESSDDIFIQSDYINPIGKDGRLEAGIRGDLRSIRSEYNAAMDGVSLPQYENKLFYDENIYGAYVQYGNKLKKLNYLLGIRSEFSNIIISDRKKTINKEKNYINFFPTVHLQYSMEKNYELQLSYSRRINRPRFWQLNSFAGLSDTRNLRVGNPDLNPMYTNVVELGLLKKTGKVTINPSVYYQYSTDYFDFIRKQNTDGTFLNTPVNLAIEKRFGTELAVIYNPFTWWRFSMDFNFYQFSQKGEYEGENYSVSDKTWFTTIRSSFRFPKVVNTDISFNYRARNKDVQSVTSSQYRANIGLSKDVLGERMSLVFAANNIFDSQESIEITETPEYYFNSYFKRLGRQFTFTVVYRFNRKKSQADRVPDEMQ